MRELASAFIRRLLVEEAKTVGDLFDEMNDNLVTHEHVSIDDPIADRILLRHSIIRQKLRAVGIWTVIAEPELELSNRVYGQVFDARKMRRSRFFGQSAKLRLTG